MIKIKVKFAGKEREVLVADNCCKDYKCFKPHDCPVRGETKSRWICLTNVNYGCPDKPRKKLMNIEKEIEDRMPDINKIKKQENRHLALMCLGNLEQIEKSIIEIEKKLKELNQLQKIELEQAKSYIETQKTLFQYFIKED